MKRTFISLLLACFIAFPACAQDAIINMAPIDGVALTPDNILSYYVQAAKAESVQVKGTIRYRNSNMSVSYSFTTALKAGLNTFSSDIVRPQWQFSSASLQELFTVYKVLPEGTYEYCVSIIPKTVLPESPVSPVEECLYHKSNDLFLINLIDPENNAKLHEYNPMLSWVANCSFSSQLIYRLRVAEIKQGQNAINAVMRNQPVFDQKGLMQNSLVYPIFAKPLEANKYYAWTVDAYYRDILLGGSETWQFTIVEDTLPSKRPETRSYIDIKREQGLNKIVAIGNLKLKYILDDAKQDSLSLEILDANNKVCSLNPSKLAAVYGDNRYTLNLADSSALKHQETYHLKITTKTRHEYLVSFRYMNPTFLR